MNLCITIFQFLVISSHKSGVGAIEPKEWETVACEVIRL